jgi:hypothetical protein
MYDPNYYGLPDRESLPVVNIEPLLQNLYVLKDGTHAGDLYRAG